MLEEVLVPEIAAQLPDTPEVTFLPRSAPEMSVGDETFVIQQFNLD